MLEIAGRKMSWTSFARVRFAHDANIHVSVCVVAGFVLTCTSVADLQVTSQPLLQTHHVKPLASWMRPCSKDSGFQWNSTCPIGSWCYMGGGFPMRPELRTPALHQKLLVYKLEKLNNPPQSLRCEITRRSYKNSC